MVPVGEMPRIGPSGAIEAFDWASGPLDAPMPARRLIPWTRAFFPV